MSVFVDLPTHKFGRMIMCHMIADTYDELIEMVDKIGVERRWIQKEGSKYEHFDISKGKRELALRRGAINLTTKELVIKIREKDPEEMRFNFFKRNGGIKVHLCPDWDFMAIHSEMPEFEACLCDFSKTKPREGQLPISIWDKDNALLFHAADLCTQEKWNMYAESEAAKVTDPDRNTSTIYHWTPPKTFKQWVKENGPIKT